MRHDLSFIVSGSCVQAQVEEWSQVVVGKAFSEISSISLLEIL